MRASLRLARCGRHEFWQLPLRGLDIFLIFEEHIQRVGHESTVQIPCMKQHQAFRPIDRFGYGGGFFEIQ